MSGKNKFVKLAPTRPLYLAIDGTMSHDSTHLGRLLEKKGWAENLLDLLPAAKETGRREPGFLLRHLPIVRVDDKTAPTNDARRGATVCLPGGVNGWGQEGFWRAWSEGSGADERVAKVDWGDGLVTYGRHTAAERSARAVPSLFLHAAVEIAWGVGGQDPARLVADPSGIDVLSEVARPDLVFVSSHGFMGGTFRGDGLLAWGAAEPKTVGAGHTAPTKGYFPSSNYFTLGQAVASGEKFMGPKWLILALCSAANEATWPLWVTLFARSTPQVRGLLAYEESAPSAAGAITTSEAFVSHIAAGKTMLEAWREANDARKQKWAAVVHEDAHKDTLSAFGALAKLDPEKKWIGYRPGEAGVEVPPETKAPFELVVESAWRNDDGTLGDWEEAKPETLDGAHLSPGNPYRVTVRPPAGKKARSAAVELIHVREARPRVPWRQVFTAPAATSKATAATLEGTASIRLEAQAGHDGKELQAQFDAEKNPPDRGHSYWWFKVKLELDDGSSPEHPFRLQGYMW